MANYNSQHTGTAIDEAVRQTAVNTRDIATEVSRATSVEQALAAADADTVNRLRGTTIHPDDPFHFVSFSNDSDGTAFAKAAAWLDNLYTTDPAVKQAPVGILRIRINGSYVHAINNVLSYAEGKWTQTLLNAWVNSTTGEITPSFGTYARESYMENGVVKWTAWERLATREDIPTDIATLSQLQELQKTVSQLTQRINSIEKQKAPVVELTDYMSGYDYLPLGGVYLYGGLPVSHMRYAQNGAQSGYILFCTSHNDGSEDTGIRYLHFSTDNLHDFYFETEYDEDTVPDWVKKMFGHN